MDISKGKILIVDDEPIVRDSIKAWVADAGYEAMTAETGEEALAMIEREDFGVMIVDIRLPGKTGIAVLREVKAVKPGIKSIVITAYPSAALAAEAVKLGAVDYLVKPISPDELERLIQEALRESDLTD